MNLSEKMDARLFDDTAVRELLDEMARPSIEARYGPPRVATVYSSKGVPRERPALASTDPAVVQAMGRCYIARIQWDWRPECITALKHGTCGFCEYPPEELLAACEWGEWQSRYVLAEVLVWDGENRTSYEREGSPSHYENPAWRDFWALPIHDRERRIEAASAP